MDIFLLILRLTLAGVFATAAFGKLFDREGTEKAFANFGVPELMRQPLARVLPIVELAVALALLFVSSSWVGSVGAASLLIVFLGGMVYQLAKGNTPDCHCFGQLHSEPVGFSSIARNIVLLAMAGFLVGHGQSNQGLSMVNSNQDIMLFVLGLAIIGLLGALVFLLKRVSDQQNDIVRRLEVMELVRDSGASVERDGVSHPHEGLPIGAKFPSFELPGISGGMVTLDVIRAARMPALFFFISPACAPCKALVPEFEKWQIELKDKVNVYFVSGGTSKQNKEKFGETITSQILLQKGRELADAARAKWTPTAIFVDVNGRVASHAAAGDTAIRGLVERIKSEDLGKDNVHFAFENGNAAKTLVGEKVPEFSLPDLKGQSVTSDIFKGKTTIATFWDTGCGHCRSLLSELREWDTTRDNGDPEMIVFSSGDVELNAALGFESPTLIDEGYRISGKLGMLGTPSAVLVDPDGVIISETAIGAPGIWALIGKQK